MVLNLCKDKSWRVRYNAADKICDLYGTIRLSDGKDDETLIDAFVRLLEDSEAEVQHYLCVCFPKLPGYYFPILTFRLHLTLNV